MRKKLLKTILSAMAVLTCSLALAFPVQAANVRTPVADGKVTYGKEEKYIKCFY